MHFDIIVLRVYIRHFINDIEVKVQSAFDSKVVNPH